MRVFARVRYASGTRFLDGDAATSHTRPPSSGRCMQIVRWANSVAFYSREMLPRLNRAPALASLSIAAIVLATGCENVVKLQTPKGTIGGTEGEGEGEGGSGIVFDCPAESSATDLNEMAGRFVTDIDPLMERAEGGCIACHYSDSGRLMTLADTAQNSFFRIRASGFFRLTNGAIAERVVH